MNNKQLTCLFVCNFLIYFIGTGLLPLLPLYASQFGAAPTAVGFYLAFTYVSITVGTMLTGRLAERLTGKGLFIAAGALGVPALVLLGQATAWWQLVILTAIVWFCIGIGTALISVFTGLYADGNSRGKSFSLMFLAYPLAAMIAGLVVGRLVVWHGYSLMFAVLAAVWAAWPVVGLLWLKNEPVSTAAPSTAVSDRIPHRLRQTFYLLLLVTLLSEMTIYISRLGASLSMELLNFSPDAVASTMTAGGLIMIPITLLIGVLSDRLGRQGILVTGFLLATAGALTLGRATQLWHFWLASVLLFGAMSTNGSVAGAFATDLLGPEALSRGLPWLNAMTWIAGIVGFASAGYVMDTLGATTLYLSAAVLSAMAVMLMRLLSRQYQAIPRARNC